MKKFNHVAVLIFITIISSSSMSLSGAADNAINFRDQIIANKPVNGEVAAINIRNLNGAEYVFIKYIDSYGDLSGLILNPQGETVTENNLPTVNRQIIGNRLKNILNKDTNGLAQDNLISVIIGFREDSDADNEITETGTAEIRDGLSFVTVNGKEVSDDEFENIQHAKQNNLDNKRKDRTAKRQARIQKFAVRNGLLNNPNVQISLENGYNSVILSLTKDQITDLANQNPDLVEGIDFYDEPQDE